jgi:hypothetical protein
MIDNWNTATCSAGLYLNNDSLYTLQKFFN